MHLSVVNSFVACTTGQIELYRCIPPIAVDVVDVGMLNERNHCDGSTMELLG